MAIQDTNLKVKVTPFPPGTCFNNDQDLANGVAAAIQVIFPGALTPWNIGSDEPTVNNRDKPWLKTDAVTNTIVGIGTWSPFYGRWLGSHWLGNGNSPPIFERRIFVGTLSQLESYDGGSPGTVSDVTGPFWQQAEAVFTGHVPAGVSGVDAVLLTATTPFKTGADATIQVVGVYFIQPTGRIYDVLA